MWSSPPAARAGYTSFLVGGLVPHAGDPFFLPRLLPFHRLNEAAMLGETLDSETLHEWGAVNRLVPSEEVQVVADQLAQRLAAGPTRTLGLTKRLYRRSLVSDMATAFGEEAAATALVALSHDRVEGIRAMVERRDPTFTGS
ncbi:MAG: enoyl-CoA hydratase-related protein [Acidimicrobiales bacterium]